MESHLFWFVATFNCVLAFGFALKQRRLVSKASKSARPELSKGQEKDNWLICAVVWGVIFGGHTDLSRTLMVLGALVLAWTAWRTLQRIAALPR